MLCHLECVGGLLALGLRLWKWGRRRTGHAYTHHLNSTGLRLVMMPSLMARKGSLCFSVHITNYKSENFINRNKIRSDTRM